MHRRTPALHSRESTARPVVGRGEEASCQCQRRIASSDQKSLHDSALCGLRPAHWRSVSPASGTHRLGGRENLCAPLQTEESPNLSSGRRSRECTGALYKGGQAALSPPRSLADTQAAIPAGLGWRSFHDDSKARKATRPEAQAIRFARSASCLCYTPSRPGSDTEGSGRSLGTRVGSGYSDLCQVDLIALREVAALDVRPLVDCIEQCEQIAAPFFRIGEIRALREVGNLGLGGVA